MQRCRSMPVRSAKSCVTIWMVESACMRLCLLASLGLHAELPMIPMPSLSKCEIWWNMEYEARKRRTNRLEHLGTTSLQEKGCNRRMPNSRSTKISNFESLAEVSQVRHLPNCSKYTKWNIWPWKQRHDSKSIRNSIGSYCKGAPWEDSGSQKVGMCWSNPAPCDCSLGLYWSISCASTCCFKKKEAICDEASSLLKSSQVFSSRISWTQNASWNSRFQDA